MREGGALPATIAMVEGEARVGLDDDALAAVAEREDVLKCGVRDLAPLAARGGWGGTTVAATAHLAARAGIRVFATGGLGGVHRGARESWDESADLDDAGLDAGSCVVCAGVKSILDVGATLERLETLNVTVLGYAHRPLPRLLSHRLGPSGGVARRLAGGGRGGGDRAGRSSAPTTARWWSRTRCRRTSSSTPRCTTAFWPRASQRPSAQGSRART